ncbi:MAG TPA: site-specific DNA-methyltransferase [Solirubrobacteraceae bacterium]|nr:site-specific DNA-methyltransferase [Solirubrobacteraceae bacterium]
MGVRLEWEGKPPLVERLSLPFQTVETINESRATRERDTGALFGGAADGVDTSRNQLIWGDNKLVMSSLLSEYAGQIKLVYIDPPFDTGTDFSYRVSVGDTTVDKLPSVLEEHAYRDTWGRRPDSYLSMMYERLVLIHELLSSDGSLYLHCAPNVSHYLRLVCDEIFGPTNFRSEIIWKRTTAHSDTKQGRALHGGIHDVILFYTKGDSWTWNTIYVPYDQAYIELKYRFIEEETGRRYRLGDLTAAKPGGDTSFEWHGRRPYKGRYWAYSRENMDQMHAEGRIRFPDKPDGVPEYKRYLDEMPGVPLQDVWTDLDPINARALERLGYATQKPESLVERIVKTSSNEGDLVADFFCGSGTTLAVAEKIDRRWVGCDLGRFAIHTSRKRLLNIPDCRPFEIRNLGAYERQRWQVATGNGALRAYLDTILAFYRAEPVEGFAHLHGRKAGRMVHVGATDAPVTIDETEDVMDEMADNGIDACDLLGWEWEMGLHDTISETARRRGLDLRPRQIPREVMERQVTDADAVRFFELAHVDLDIRRRGREASVVLTDFLIPSEELIPTQVRDQISSWADLIDYWSVDFDFSDEVFHNQWQAYRTREQPALATQSDWHEYPRPGRYAIVVKIIDIFGNDTTKLAEVRIK